MVRSINTESWFCSNTYHLLTAMHDGKKEDANAVLGPFKHDLDNFIKRVWQEVVWRAMRTITRL